jgi:trans-aconitate methyltransferase
MTFDSAAYWRARGKVYERNFRAERYRAQEAALVETLRPLRFRTVLEVGCGFGRIGELVMELRPDVDYTGTDVSQDQLDAARRRLGPRARLELGDLRRIATTRRYDLVLAIEVLMHVPPADIAAVVATLGALTRGTLVTLDLSRPIGRKVSAPDFLHDYRALLGPDATERPIGAQSIWVR